MSNLLSNIIAQQADEEIDADEPIFSINDVRRMMGDVLGLVEAAAPEETK